MHDEQLPTDDTKPIPQKTRRESAWTPAQFSLRHLLLLMLGVAVLGTLVQWTNPGIVFPAVAIGFIIYALKLVTGALRRLPVEKSIRYGEQFPNDEDSNDK